MNTEMPLSAKAEKLTDEFTPITPTIDRPVTVISEVPLMLDIPLMGLRSSRGLALITVPGSEGLKVFFTRMGIFLTQTG